MTQSPEIDVQAQAILMGLKALASLLDEPVARDALDLAEKTGRARTHAQYNLLQRLRRSLSQYLERGGDLFYVGLLGHFSSGKSSTINSVLATWNTDDERKTDLNPTDTIITLITGEQNVQSLLGVIREGHVTIRYQGLDNALLENIVLADTPGTGDPHLVQEIARDFLPICDVILFFFSAASPLDQTDMPLLMELHKRLPFIPIRFIVTRADELRLDSSKPVSEQNIDKPRRIRFFADVLSRVNKLLEPTVYTEEDFILIDNKVQYNIESVIDLIKSKCDPANPNSKIVMHGHKLHYFRSTARDLKKFFGDFLDEKLQELNKILGRAEQNIQRYNENVRISNNHLTLRWHEQLGAVRTAKTAAEAYLHPADPLPVDIAGFDFAIAKRSEISRDLSREVDHVWRNLTSRFMLDVSTKIRQSVSAIDDWTEETSDSVATGPAHELLEPIKVEHDVILPLVPSFLASFWASLRQAQAAALRTAASDLRKQIEDAQRAVERRSPLVECETEVRTAQKSLSDDLDQFFRNVELYRDGVFSHTTKESISTLGIGAQLDSLEREFTESDKAVFTAETMESLFPNFPEISARALTAFSDLDRNLRSLMIASKDLKIPSPEVVHQSLAPILERERGSLLNSLTAELQDSVGHLRSKLQVRIRGTMVESRLKYEAAMKSARRDRIFRYTTIVIATGMFAGATYAGYVYLNKEISHNIFNAIIWEVLAGFIVAAIGFMIARWLDNFPKTSAKIRRDFQSLFKSDVSKITDEELRNHEFSAISHDSFTARLRKACTVVINSDPDEWQQVAAERINTLREWHNEYRRVQAKYSWVVEQTTEDVSAYFSDATKNLEVLNTVANRIKARAIEPSFDLLAQTSQSLGSVKSKIHQMEFS
jgi:predicted GTPase